MLVVRFFARPLANLITPLFHNNGWTPDRTTHLRIYLSATLLVLLAIGHHWATLLAVVLFYLNFVLDCVDGNLARLQNAASYYGKFIDGLADSWYVYLTPMAAALSVGLDGPAYILILGAACTITALNTHVVRNRLSFFREWMESQSGSLDESQAQAFEQLKRRESKPLALMTNVTMLSPLLLLHPHGLIAYLVVLVTLQVPADIYTTGANLAAARGMLNRWRMSASDARRMGSKQENQGMAN